MSGTDIAPSGSCLRASYTKSGTETASAAILNLRACYDKSEGMCGQGNRLSEHPVAWKDDGGLNPASPLRARYYLPTRLLCHVRY
eukprot:2683815-Rhodomonas_salina.3